MMEKVFALMEQAMLTDLPVLLMGETGTGKELVARALHVHGSRKGKPFIIQNCGALTSTLYESELFGHKRGAFTGAIADRRGLFEEANGGTIFLDEIGEASLDLQIRLLRVIDCGEIRRVGENQSRKVDVRVVAATNQDLLAVMEAERFRQDLYYRLNGFQMWLPPLRDRREDIPLLVVHFLQRSCAKLGKEVYGVTDEAMDRLLQHDWPGNVRELEHCLEAAVIVCQNSLISPDDLQLDGHVECTVGTLHRCEQEHIMQVLQVCKGNKSRAARILGISPNTLYIKLHHYGLLGRE